MNIYYNYNFLIIISEIAILWLPAWIGTSDRTSRITSLNLDIIKVEFIVLSEKRLFFFLNNLLLHFCNTPPHRPLIGHINNSRTNTNRRRTVIHHTLFRGPMILASYQSLGGTHSIVLLWIEIHCLRSHCRSGRLLRHVEGFPLDCLEIFGQVGVLAYVGL